MQKFNEKIVEEVITNLEILTTSISDILSEKNALPSNRERLNELLEERAKFIDIFIQFPFDEELKKFFSDNFNNWTNRITKVIEKDKANLRTIEIFLQSLSEEIKNFNRQKSLIIYSKGQ